MTDITMCLNKLCPNASSCRRVTARHSNYQSVAMFKYTVGKNGVICVNYWKNHGVKTNSRTYT